MFRQTIFFLSFLDVKLMLNGPLYCYILLRKVEEDTKDVISFKLFRKKISFGRHEFDMVTS